jgi:hypothetical protein
LSGVECHPARCWSLKISNDPEQSRFAAPARPNYADELIDTNVESHIAKRLNTAAVAAERVTDSPAGEVETGRAA